LQLLRQRLLPLSLVLRRCEVEVQLQAVEDLAEAMLLLLGSHLEFPLCLMVGSIWMPIL